LYENLYRAFANKEYVEELMEGDDDKVTVKEVVDATVTVHKNGTMDLFATFEQLEQATTTKTNITENDHLYQYIDSPKAQKIGRQSS
jgi:DNA polymerase-1